MIHTSHQSAQLSVDRPSLCSKDYGNSSNSSGTSSPVPDNNKNNSQSESAVDEEKVDSTAKSDTSVRSSSPDLMCPICLGHLENRSYTDTCFHKFCFVCLVEWSKVRPVCPLCKQQFTSVIHSIRSYSEFEQFPIGQNAAEGPNAAENRNRFRYRTTVVQGTSERRQQQLDALQRPSRLRYRGRSRFDALTPVYTSAFRRSIYRDELWVRSSAEGGRVRDTSAAFFARNPACSHRLVPWLNRELMALLRNSGDVTFLLDVILSTISRIDIRSEAFHDLVSPFLGARTRHFVHEFYTFASSPFDMAAYDTRAAYERPPRVAETAPIEFTDSSDNESSNDDADVIEVSNMSVHSSVQQKEASSSSFLSTIVEQSHSSASARRANSLSETVSQLHTNAAIRRMFSEAWPSLNSSAAFLRPRSPVADPSQLSASSQPETSTLHIHNSRVSQSAKNAASVSSGEPVAGPSRCIIPSSTEPVAGPSRCIIPSSTLHSVADEDESDGEVVITAVDKPWRERSPVVLTNSDSESENVAENPTDEHSMAAESQSAGECEMIGHVSPPRSSFLSTLAEDHQPGCSAGRSSVLCESENDAAAMPNLSSQTKEEFKQKCHKHHHRRHRHRRHHRCSRRDDNMNHDEVTQDDGGKARSRSRRRHKSHHHHRHSSSSLNDVVRQRLCSPNTTSTKKLSTCHHNKTESMNDRSAGSERVWLSDDSDDSHGRRTVNSVVVIPQAFKKHHKGHKRTAISSSNS